MPWHTTGRVAVVTGASSGIGEATARRLANAGMTVVAVARRQDRLDALATTGGIRPYVADVTSTQQIDRLANWVGATFGACHALVNNAGVRGTLFAGRNDLEAALDTLDVNLNGTLRCMASFAELLRDSAPSRVVNVASVAGKLGVGPAAYAASKFAVVGLSEATSFSWARDGVSVCQLNPGFIETEGFSQKHLRRSAAGRLVGAPEDVARAIHHALINGDVIKAPERSWHPGIRVAQPQRARRRLQAQVGTRAGEGA